MGDAEANRAVVPGHPGFSGWLVERSGQPLDEAYRVRLRIPAMDENFRPWHDPIPARANRSSHALGQ